jgi:hypothetical protein
MPWPERDNVLSIKQKQEKFRGYMSASELFDCGVSLSAKLVPTFQGHRLSRAQRN